MTIAQQIQKAAQLQSVTPRSSIALVSDHSRLLLHDGSGTTLTDSAPAALEILGDLTINGTTAGIWATEGWLTPAGDHGMQVNSANAQAMGDMSTLRNVGQLIFFCEFYATGVPATTQNMLLMYGRTTAGQGRIAFSIETTGRFQVQIKNTSDTYTSSNTGLYGSVCDSVEHSLVGILDMVNGTTSTYVDGIAQGSSSFNTTLADGVDSRGWGVFANITTDAPVFNNYFGAGGITGARIRNIGLIRTASDQSANIGSIVDGLNKIRNELPWALDGV